MAKASSKIETQLIHAGEVKPRILGAVCMPIFQSANFEYKGEDKQEALIYMRHNNTPNHDLLHKKLATLENGESALVTASGMAAISAALLAVLSSGDHLLAQNCLYGGTHSFITQDLPQFGISHDFVDGEDVDSWKKKLKPNTKAFYVEGISNPLMEVIHLEAVVKFCKENNLISIIDNTIPTPINFRPLDLGFDLSLHSATKYLNGHSDIVAGACIGKNTLIEKITHMLNHLGGSLDAHTAFLLDRGMKTLALRVRHQNESAMNIARFLEKHPAVSRVNYPGLESHPSHQRAKALFSGFSGMISFELKGGAQAAERFVSALEIPAYAPSLGGVETLITLPAKTSHAGLSQEKRQQLGISEGLIRFSVGIEATVDLIADLEQALKKTSSTLLHSTIQ